MSKWGVLEVRLPSEECAGLHIHLYCYWLADLTVLLGAGLQVWSLHKRACLLDVGGGRTARRS